MKARESSRQEIERSGFKGRKERLSGMETIWRSVHGRVTEVKDEDTRVVCVRVMWAVVWEGAVGKKNVEGII